MSAASKYGRFQPPPERVVKAPRVMLTRGDGKETIWLPDQCIGGRRIRGVASTPTINSHALLLWIFYHLLKR